MAKNIEKYQAVLDRLKDLSASGFGEEQVARLAAVLAGWGEGLETQVQKS